MYKCTHPLVTLFFVDDQGRDGLLEPWPERKCCSPDGGVFGDTLSKKPSSICCWLLTPCNAYTCHTRSLKLCKSFHERWPERNGQVFGDTSSKKLRPIVVGRWLALFSPGISCTNLFDLQPGRVCLLFVSLGFLGVKLQVKDAFAFFSCLFRNGKQNKHVPFCHCQSFMPIFVLQFLEETLSAGRPLFTFWHDKPK